VHRAQGHYAEADKLFSRAFTIARPEQPDAAEKLLLGALAIRVRVLGPEHPDLARTLDSLANAHRAQGHNADAEKARALAIQEKVLGSWHLDVAVARQAQGASANDSRPDSAMVESAATEVVSIGRALFKHGEHSQ